MIHLLGTIALLAGAVVATLFVVLYHLSAHWWGSEEGWHVMSFTGAIAAVLDFTSVRALTATPLHLPPGVDVARTLIFGTVAGLLAWRLWMLYRIQIRPSWRRSR